jgi:homoserine kinase
MTITVAVPASSANLGPGFDAFGLALSLQDRLTAEIVEGPQGLVEVLVVGEGSGSVSTGSDNLVVRSMNAAWQALGTRPPAVRLTCENNIPHGRGLGSSAAAIVGGVVVAGETAGQPFEKGDVFDLAAQLEGHPDNVAAATFGGFTIAWRENADTHAARLDADVTVTVMVPSQAVSTERARALLPKNVPHADASANAGRAALLVAALTGQPDLLMAATEDWLHQSYRAEAMPVSFELVQELRAAEIPAVISGAGPTVLAFASGLSAPDGWTVHELTVDDQGVRLV